MRTLRVAVTSARRAHVLADALGRQGMEVVLASTTGGDRPVPDDQVALATDAVLRAGPTALAASTGTGMRLWIDAAERTGRREALREAVATIVAAARGAKAVAGLRLLGRDPDFVSPRDLDLDVAGWLQRQLQPGDVLVTQVPGRATPAFDGLARRGVRVLPVATYACTRPADERPARDLVASIVAGSLDAVAFTSPAAVDGLVSLAACDHVEAALAGAFEQRVLAAAIGHVTAAALERHGVPVALMPDRPRSASLVRSLAGCALRPPPPRRVLRLDPDAAAVDVGHRRWSLGVREFGVLASLARRPGVACRLHTLATEAWGPHALADDRQVRHQVARLRRKLGDVVAIETVRGVGYRLAGPT